MSIAGQGPRKCSAWVALVLFVPVAATAFPGGQDAPSSQQQGAATAGQSEIAAPHSSSQQLPDSPGALQSQPAVQFQQPAGQQLAPAPPNQTQPQEPVGTAAAGMVSPSGVTASKPAGAAIAPAKQRRVRTILISVGTVLGAGAAIGTVAALSSASPSRPPGSH
jgi:hypothetical protein